MIYTHYDTMPEIICDYVYEIEGEYMAIEQDNCRYSKAMMYALDELQAINNAKELSKWFKTDSVFNVYATGKQINKPVLEVVL